MLVRLGVGVGVGVNSVNLHVDINSIKLGLLYKLMCIQRGRERKDI